MLDSKQRMRLIRLGVVYIEFSTSKKYKKFQK